MSDVKQIEKELCNGGETKSKATNHSGKKIKVTVPFYDTQGPKGNVIELKKVDRKKMCQKQINNKDGSKGWHGNSRSTKGKVVALDRNDCHNDSFYLSPLAMEVDAILGMIRLSHI